MYETDLLFDYQKEPSRDILCLDCKSFYASVECVERGVDPLSTKLVVMSYPSDDPTTRGSGLILASSPMAKKAYGITNVSRARDLPFPYPQDLIIAAPRMRLYMQQNMELNNLYKSYVDEANHHVYSVDESFMDVTSSLRLFGCQNAWEMARKIQTDAYQRLGLYTTIGIGDNPLLAKLALDNAAKDQGAMIAEWRYQDVPNTLWQLPKITDFWGISRRTAKQLRHLGITSVAELAHSNYYVLKDRLGVIGAQLYAHSWGIDRSFLGEQVTPASKSIGNSQILHKDYLKRSEIEIVIKEMADQVATRLRREQAKAQVVSLWVGYSNGYLDQQGQRGFHQQRKLPATNATGEIARCLLQIFAQHYQQQEIRSIGVNTGNLVYTNDLQLNLFEDSQQQIRHSRMDDIVDTIRQKYGFKSVVRAVSTLEGGTAIRRSNLVGGHAGGMAGIEGEQHEKN